jgi:hypothetical protein
MLGAGALAGALASVIAVGTTILGWFDGGSENPEGRVERLVVDVAVVPLTYRQWRVREGVPIAGVRASQLRAKGLLVEYDMMTSGYDDDDELPVELTVYDLDTGENKRYEADPVRVRSGDSCGCSDWVPVTSLKHRNTVTVRVYPPGPIRGEPLKQESGQSTIRQ